MLNWYESRISAGQWMPIILWDPQSLTHRQKMCITLEILRQYLT
jgi:hypothetical protein